MLMLGLLMQNQPPGTPCPLPHPDSGCTPEYAKSLFDDEILVRAKEALTAGALANNKADRDRHLRDLAILRWEKRRREWVAEQETT